jgi:hypothetical protein
MPRLYQRIQFRKPDGRAAENGNAEIECLSVSSVVPSFKKYERTVEVRFGGGDGLRRNADDVFHHEDCVRGEVLDEPVAKFADRLAHLHCESGQAQDSPAMASVIAKSQYLARHRALTKKQFQTRDMRG